jgi:putative membrane protein
MSVELRESAQVRIAVYALSLLVCGAVALVFTVVPAQPPPQGPSPLATLNAALNAGATCLLTFGYWAIRKRKIHAHRLAMLGAFSLSTLFLISYLVHHAQVGSVPFQGVGWIRVAYFAVLIPHILLAAVIVPLALLSIYRGLSAHFPAHKRIARITLPLWLYVSVSGVALYGMLYYS